MNWTLYRQPFLTSLGLHLGLLLLILWQPHQTQAVLEANERSHVPEQMAKAEQPAPIQAVAVDAQQVQEAMQKIAAERQRVRDQELNRQHQLALEAQRAKMAKMAEMKRLSELKKQAETLKAEQEKMKQEAALRLKKIEEEKQAQEKKLAEVKQKQVEEAKKLQEMAKLRQQEAAKKSAALAAAKTAENLANQQRMAGEVDRYKALILNAIRDRWILPENIDPGLSSQFVIRLAPTGAVLDVRLTRSSGDSLLDRSAQAAIYKASPLPVPSDAMAFNMFREISLTVRPSNARG